MRTRFCPSPTGMVARRPDADGAVQLGARAAHRRHVRLPHRGHRRRARLRGVLPAPARLHALARPRLGRGPRGRRPARALPAVRAPRDLPRGRGQAAGRRARLRVVLHQRGGRRPPAGRRAGHQARLRQPRPVPHRRAEGRLPGRGPRAGAAAEDARRGPRVDRPRPRRDPLRRRLGAGLRAGPGQRRAAVPVRQPRGRRPDGHHRRPARRGPAALHAAAARALRGADRHRRRLGHPAVRAPALRDRRGQQEALQARPAVEPRHLPRARLPARGARELPGAARLVDRRGPGHLLDGGDGRGLRRHAGERQPRALRPEEGRGDQRHPPARAAGRGLHRPRRPVPRRRPAWSAIRRPRSSGASSRRSPRWPRSG